MFLIPVVTYRAQPPSRAQSCIGGLKCEYVPNRTLDEKTPEVSISAAEKEVAVASMQQLIMQILGKAAFSSRTKKHGLVSYL